MNLLERVVIEPFEKLSEKVLQFLPNFLTSLLILVVGIILGLFIKVILSKILKAVKLDKFSERFGVMEVLKKGGIEESLSALLSRILGWIIIVIFIVISLRALEIPTVESLLERFLLYLPNVFIALIIIFGGYLLSNFLGRAALIASVNAGLEIAGLIGKLVKMTVLILAVTMSLEQLGVGGGTLIVAFAILFGGFVLSLSIAFGLGGRDIVKAYLEEKIKGERKKDEISHL